MITLAQEIVSGYGVISLEHHEFTNEYEIYINDTKYGTYTNEHDAALVYVHLVYGDTYPE